MGSKCLLVTSVSGRSLVAKPPARTTPFIRSQSSFHKNKESHNKKGNENIFYHNLDGKIMFQMMMQNSITQINESQNSNNDKLQILANWKKYYRTYSQKQNSNNNEIVKKVCFHLQNESPSKKDQNQNCADQKEHMINIVPDQTEQFFASNIDHIEYKSGNEGNQSANCHPLCKDTAINKRDLAHPCNKRLRCYCCRCCRKFDFCSYSCCCLSTLPSTKHFHNKSRFLSI